MKKIDHLTILMLPDTVNIRSTQGKSAWLGLADFFMKIHENTFHRETAGVGKSSELRRIFVIRAGRKRRLEPKAYANVAKFTDPGPSHTPVAFLAPSFSVLVSRHPTR